MELGLVEQKYCFPSQNRQTCILKVKMRFYSKNKNTAQFWNVIEIEVAEIRGVFKKHGAGGGWLREARTFFSLWRFSFVDLNKFNEILVLFEEANKM